MSQPRPPITPAGDRQGMAASFVRMAAFMMGLKQVEQVRKLPPTATLADVIETVNRLIDIQSDAVRPPKR